MLTSGFENPRQSPLDVSCIRTGSRLAGLYSRDHGSQRRSLDCYRSDVSRRRSQDLDIPLRSPPLTENNPRGFETPLLSNVWKVSPYEPYFAALSGSGVLHSRIAIRFVILADNDHEGFSHDGPKPDQLAFYGDDDGRRKRASSAISRRAVVQQACSACCTAHFGDPSF